MQIFQTTQKENQRFSWECQNMRLACHSCGDSGREYFHTLLKYDVKIPFGNDKQGVEFL
ncbi:hypothetical protein [Chryseobacterium taeanense]|uniref:hypothetical protein n=1 Tax=Chryseobacterium taeanense TaxID=311334 RepID=UPI0035B28950